MARLTKQAILEGSKMRSTLTIKEYGDAEVVIRPLTDGELSKIFAVIGNVPLKQDGTPDLGQLDIDKNLEALRMAASMGLEEPKLSPEEVASMKFGVPEFIGLQVLELSGLWLGFGEGPGRIMERPRQEVPARVPPSLPTSRGGPRHRPVALRGETVSQARGLRALLIPFSPAATATAGLVSPVLRLTQLPQWRPSLAGRLSRSDRPAPIGRWADPTRAPCQAESHPNVGNTGSAASPFQVHSRADLRPPFWPNWAGTDRRRSLRFASPTADANQG